MPRSARAHTLANWFTRRQLPAEHVDTTVFWGQWALRVIRLRPPANMRYGQVLDDLAKRHPKKRPGILRVVDPDPGRTELIVRLDDALPFLTAWQEENW